MIRNFINVVGISEEGELPTECPGQFVEYSETDYLFIPETTPAINTLYEINLGIEIFNSRLINMKDTRVYILDGTKRFKISCSSKDKSNKPITLKLNFPFNAFIDIENNDKVKSAKVFVLDAYFHLINPKTIYSNITYLISVEYSDTTANYNSHSTSKKSINTDFETPLSSNTQKLIITEDILELSSDELNDIKINNNSDSIAIMNPGLAEQSLTKEDLYPSNKDLDLHGEYL